jgi:hypothetical protein
MGVCVRVTGDFYLTRCECPTPSNLSRIHQNAPITCTESKKEMTDLLHTPRDSQQAPQLGSSLHARGRTQSFPYEKHKPRIETPQMREQNAGMREREFEAIPSSVTLPDLEAPPISRFSIRTHNS